MNVAVPFVVAESMSLAEWLAADGASVTRDEPVCNVLLDEGDLIESVMLLTAPCDGVLTHTASKGQRLSPEVVVATVSPVGGAVVSNVGLTPSPGVNSPARDSVP